MPDSTAVIADHFDATAVVGVEQVRRLAFLCSRFTASFASLAALRCCSASRSRSVRASLSTSVPSAAVACVPIAILSGSGSLASIACCSATVASWRREGAGAVEAGSTAEERTAGGFGSSAAAVGAADAAPPPFGFFFFPAPALRIVHRMAYIGLILREFQIIP